MFSDCDGFTMSTERSGHAVYLDERVKRCGYLAQSFTFAKPCPNE